LCCFELYIYSIIINQKTKDMKTLVTKKEIREAREFLMSGGRYINEASGYYIGIRKDGQRIFDVNGSYKFHKDLDSFVRDAIRTVKRGG
jgi:hypothetical protein